MIGVWDRLVPVGFSGREARAMAMAVARVVHTQVKEILTSNLIIS